MFSDPDGPITSFEWGRFVINGEPHSAEGEGVGKDICLFDGEVHAWHTRKGHRLEPHMVEVALGQSKRFLVIGTGVRGRIRVPKKTRKAIKSGGIKELIIEPTPEACETYNRLVRAGEQVILLAHGTC